MMDPEQDDVASAASISTTASILERIFTGPFTPCISQISQSQQGAVIEIIIWGLYPPAKTNPAQPNNNATSKALAHLLGDRFSWADIFPYSPDTANSIFDSKAAHTFADQPAILKPALDRLFEVLHDVRG